MWGSKSHCPSWRLPQVSFFLVKTKRIKIYLSLSYFFRTDPIYPIRNKFVWFYHQFLVRYDLNTETWSNHSVMLQVVSIKLLTKKVIEEGKLSKISQPRDEASMARLGSEIYLMGGQGVKTTEVHFLRPNFWSFQLQ